MSFQTLGLTLPEKRGNPIDNPSVSLKSPAAWEWFDGGRNTESNEVIDDHTALKIATVYICCRVLSESVASLPIRLLRVTPQGKVQELENPLYALLAVAPNLEMTSFVYFEYFRISSKSDWQQLFPDGTFDRRHNHQSPTILRRMVGLFSFK
jgi:Phage portal protein